MVRKSLITLVCVDVPECLKEGGFDAYILYEYDFSALRPRGSTAMWSGKPRSYSIVTYYWRLHL